MKKIIIATLVATSIFAAQIVELACDKGYAPYSYKDGKVVKGAYVDVIQSAVDKIPDYDVKFKAIAWKKAISSVKKGKAIGLFPPYYKKERESWIRYSEALLPESTVIFAKESTHKGKVKFPEDFAGLTVCLNRGFGQATLGGENFAQMIKNKKIKLKEGNNNKICLNQVKKNKADFYLNDQLIDVSNFPTITRGLSAQKNHGYIGFTLKDKKYPYIKDFEAKFNKVIIQMKKDGEIDKILKKYQ